MTHHGNDGNEGNDGLARRSSPSEGGNERERRDNGDPVEALRSELKRVPLPPAFAARVRQRIDEAPEARGAAWLSGWRWMMPVAAVGAIAIAVFTVTRPQTRPEAPLQLEAKAPSIAPSPTVATQAPAVSSAPEVDGRQGGGAESSKFEVRSPKVSRSAASAVRVVAATEPALEVITNQPALYRALWTSARKVPSSVEVTTTVVPDTVQEVTVPPVEVNPIVVKWLGDPALAPRSLPIVR